MLSKIVQKFGNGGHVVLPKEYVGKRIKFSAETKVFADIRDEVLEILKPYSDKILGVYLYGSYARNEQTFNSDVDILVIVNKKLKIVEKINNYSIISVTVTEIEQVLKENAVLLLPIIKEAKTIINPVLLEKYKDYNFTKQNTKQLIDDTAKILELNKKGLELDFEVGSLVYSLMLRIRSLLMIQLISKGKHYSKSLLFNHLGKKFSGKKVNELYSIYSKERDDNKVRESNVITRKDIQKLIEIAEKLLSRSKRLKRK